MGDTQIFDLEMLQGLLEALGKDQCSSLITGFLDTADNIVTDIAALKESNAIFEKAHEMKGMAANFGFSELSEIAKTIEDLSQAGDVEAAHEHIKKLPDANQRAKKGIAEWLDQAA